MRTLFLWKSGTKFPLLFLYKIEMPAPIEIERIENTVRDYLESEGYEFVDLRVERALPTYINVKYIQSIFV
ncbi:hypothetical protein KAU08_12950 [bacterium]|nr:hypothetical protein [bacterium]